MIADADDAENTRVDLGEDLLEKTAVLERPASSTESFVSSPLPTVTDVEDALKTAGIYMNEGFLEEAKKIYRAVVRVQAHHAVATAKLNEIHELELRQIFREETSSRYSRQREHEETVDPDSVLSDLDRDLELGLRHDPMTQLPLSEFSLFQSQEAIRAYADRLDGELADLPPRERMDIGIAFLEMDLFELAVRQFRSVRCRVQVDSDAPELLRAAVSLECDALIRAGQPFEAVLLLEIILGDSSLGEREKIGFYYLMGRAQEALENGREAVEWYRKVHRLDPFYRDVRERMRPGRQGC